MGGRLSRSSAIVQYAPRVRIHGVFRGIGSFAVKFRWFVLVAWIIAAVAVPRALPSLSSVTQGNNANFLPASAPSEHALKLAGPLGGSTLAPLITLIPAFLAVAISGPLVAEAAQHGLKVSPLAQILLIVLVLGAGTDYGLFLVFRVRENLRSGLERKEAVIAAVERVGESITFSAATVIAALLSLLAATFEFYSDLGIPLAIGIGVMLLAGLTLLPALMAIFGRAVFWPSKTLAGTGKAGV